MTLSLLLTALLNAGLPALPSDDGSGPILSINGSAGTVALTQDTTVRTLRGRVSSDDSGAPLPYAVVEVGVGPDYRFTVADEEGRYIIRDVAHGKQRIRVTTIDHAPLEITIEIPESSDLELDLNLQIAPLALQAIIVTSEAEAVPATGSDGETAGRGSPADPELRALETTPGVAEFGLADGARAEPRVDPRDPESALYVRGAASDMKLVLLDGAPVYAPFHLGGLLQAFQPRVLQSAWLYSGGAPARYDGGLSYILELTSRPGRMDGLHTSGAFDLLGARAQFEGPLPTGSYLVSGRYMPRGGTDGPFSKPLPYGYFDGLVRADVALSPRHTLSATGFINEESVELNRLSGMTEPARWGNTAGSLRFRGPVAGGEAQITAALARFTTRLPVGVDSPGRADGQSDRLRIAADLGRRAGSLRLGYGASYDRTRIDYRARALSESGELWLFRSTEADAAAAYAEVAGKPARDVEVRGGLRANVFLSAAEARIAPRASVSWRLSESSIVSLAGGRYYQYLRVPETILSSDISAAWNELLGDQLREEAAGLGAFAVAGATHLVVGLSHAPKATLRLGMEGYFKAFDGSRQIDGLRASGVDLWVNWRDGSWAAWGGYSLGWAWTQESLESTSDRFAARHLLSGGLSAPLPSGVHFGLQLATSSGLDYTPLPSGEAGFARDSDELAVNVSPSSSGVRAGAPPGSYLRLDAQISRAFSARLLGTQFELIPYLRILNALDRRDALFYQFNVGRDLRPRSLAAVPLLPVIGIEWRQ